MFARKVWYVRISRVPSARKALIMGHDTSPVHSPPTYRTYHRLTYPLTKYLYISQWHTGRDTVWSPGTHRPMVSQPPAVPSARLYLVRWPWAEHSSWESSVAYRLIPTCLTTEGVRTHTRIACFVLLAMICNDTLHWNVRTLTRAGASARRLDEVCRLASGMLCRLA